MTYQEYQRRELLKTATIWVSTGAVIILLAIGYGTLLNRANDRIEARCAAQGGQALVTPGEVTRCLQPAR
jgi:hypothetical protein